MKNLWKFGPGHSHFTTPTISSVKLARSEEHVEVWARTLPFYHTNNQFRKDGLLRRACGDLGPDAPILPHRSTPMPQYIRSTYLEEAVGLLVVICAEGIETCGSVNYRL